MATYDDWDDPSDGEYEMEFDFEQKIEVGSEEEAIDIFNEIKNLYEKIGIRAPKIEMVEVDISNNPWDKVVHSRKMLN